MAGNQSSAASVLAACSNFLHEAREPDERSLNALLLPIVIDPARWQSVEPMPLEHPPMVPGKDSEYIDRLGGVSRRLWKGRGFPSHGQIELNSQPNTRRRSPGPVPGRQVRAWGVAWGPSTHPPDPKWTLEPHPHSGGYIPRCRAPGNGGAQLRWGNREHTHQNHNSRCPSIDHRLRGLGQWRTRKTLALRYLAEALFSIDVRSQERFHGLSIPLRY
jgi:hypothetical protein